METSIVLDRYGWEIYETTPVSGAEQWPIAEDLTWRDGLIAGFKSVSDGRDADVAWLHSEVAGRDKVVAWLHAEVANRDRTVEWLHREVAIRDSLIEELRSSRPEVKN